MKFIETKDDGPARKWSTKPMQMTSTNKLQLIEAIPAMHVEFRPLSMMDLRSRPGEILDEVSREGIAYLIERKGRQKACLTPISIFLPDIQKTRVTAELDRLHDSAEHCRVAISASHELQFLFREFSGETRIDVTVTLPHGYPSVAPIVTASPIDDDCPHLWPDRSLCIYGAAAVWNPGRHDIMHAVALFRRWIQHYSVWQHSGHWPVDS